jgi:adenylate cyclase
MPPIYLDPAPRSYPDFVHLLGRSSRGEAAAGTTSTFADLEDWLLGEAINETDMLSLTESLAWRMVAAGLPIVRATIHVGTLHPQLTGFGWSWNKLDGLCDEIVVKAMSAQSEAYMRSPLRPAVEDGQSLFLDVSDKETQALYPIAAELAEEGIKSYAVLPMPKRIGAKRFDVVTIATAEQDGFTKQQQGQLDRVLKFLALHVHRHTSRRIAENVLNVYLGPSAGKQVLEGSISRGDGNAIEAVIWVADMRGFTELTEKYSGPQVNRVLNGFFEQVVSAVTDNGGDVLKFLGDGVLAVFPFQCAATAADAAKAAMAAADEALRNLDAYNANPCEDIRSLNGWNPIRCGIAMHIGEVFFGNVGGQDRLDFTVIGSAVNETARLEALTKRVMRPVVMSQQVGDLLEIPLDDIGHHELKGIVQPVRVFAPKHWKSTAIQV